MVRVVSLACLLRDKGEGDVPSSYQLMSAYEDRSRHLAGETVLFYGGYYIRIRSYSQKFFIWHF